MRQISTKFTNKFEFLTFKNLVHSEQMFNIYGENDIVEQFPHNGFTLWI